MTQDVRQWRIMPRIFKHIKREKSFQKACMEISAKGVGFGFFFFVFFLNDQVINSWK